MLSTARSSVALIALLSAGPLLNAQILTVQDGTPVRLRLMQAVSSADAQAGQTVDFEVSEPVVNQGVVVIPKGALAFGTVTKAEQKRRFGRAGALEISVESVRLADGARAPLRATRDRGTGAMGNGRLAATIAAAPVLVWIKGRDVAFDKGMETTAFLNGDVRLDQAQLLHNQRRPGEIDGAAAQAGSADRRAPDAALTNSDIVRLQKAGLSEELILAKIKSTPGEYRTGTDDLIQLKAAGLTDGVIAAMVQKSVH
jgi:hypothetical protein